MKFSDFVTRVLKQLHTGYGWAAPWAHIEHNLGVLDIIQTEWVHECNDDLSVSEVHWTARVESTALKCNSG